MLLLGVTILGRGTRLTARGGDTRRWLALLYPERREVESRELSVEELMYPDEESYESDIPESECASLLSNPFSKLFSELSAELSAELLSSARWVHSSPHPRDVDLRAIGSKGVNGRSG